jgi:hypothetical protein
VSPILPIGLRTFTSVRQSDSVIDPAPHGVDVQSVAVSLFAQPRFLSAQSVAFLLAELADSICVAAAREGGVSLSFGHQLLDPLSLALCFGMDRAPSCRKV